MPAGAGTYLHGLTAGTATSAAALARRTAKVGHAPLARRFGRRRSAAASAADDQKRGAPTPRALRRTSPTLCQPWQARRLPQPRKGTQARSRPDRLAPNTSRSRRRCRVIYFFLWLLKLKKSQRKKAVRAGCATAAAPPVTPPHRAHPTRSAAVTSVVLKKNGETR